MGLLFTYGTVRYGHDYGTMCLTICLTEPTASDRWRPNRSTYRCGDCKIESQPAPVRPICFDLTLLCLQRPKQDLLLYYKRHDSCICCLVFSLRNFTTLRSTYMAQVPQALSTEVPTREQIQQVRTSVYALLACATASKVLLLLPIGMHSAELPALRIRNWKIMKSLLKPYWRIWTQESCKPVQGRLVWYDIGC